jgi:hypothetical protein
MTIILAGYHTPSARAADAVSFEVEMLGANEVPAASSAGSGHAAFTFDEATKVLTYTVTMMGLPLDQITASHIHKAPAGTAGPPVYTLASAPFETISGSITLTDADIVDLKGGGLYVNIHSTGDPSGFARGQLALPASTPGAPAAGSAGLGARGQGSDWSGPLVVSGLAAVLASLAVAFAAGFASRDGRRS